MNRPIGIVCPGMSETCQRTSRGSLAVDGFHTMSYKYSSFTRTRNSKPPVDLEADRQADRQACPVRALALHVRIILNVNS